MGEHSQYVKAAESKETIKPGNKSYETVVEASKDKLIRAKLQFVKCEAGHIQPFLATFQSDKPLTPFLSSDHYQIINVEVHKERSFFQKLQLLRSLSYLMSLTKASISTTKRLTLVS